MLLLIEIVAIASMVWMRQYSSALILIYLACLVRGLDRSTQSMARLIRNRALIQDVYLRAVAKKLGITADDLATAESEIQAGSPSNRWDDREFFIRKTF